MCELRVESGVDRRLLSNFISHTKKGQLLNIGLMERECKGSGLVISFSVAQYHADIYCSWRGRRRWKMSDTRTDDLTFWWMACMLGPCPTLSYKLRDGSPNRQFFPPPRITRHLWNRSSILEMLFAQPTELAGLSNRYYWGCGQVKLMSLYAQSSCKTLDRKLCLLLDGLKSEDQIERCMGIDEKLYDIWTLSCGSSQPQQNENDSSLYVQSAGTRGSMWVRLAGGGNNVFNHCHTSNTNNHMLLFKIDVINWLRAMFPLSFWITFLLVAPVSKTKFAFLYFYFELSSSLVILFYFFVIRWTKTVYTFVVFYCSWGIKRGWSLVIEFELSWNLNFWWHWC